MAAGLHQATSIIASNAIAGVIGGLGEVGEAGAVGKAKGQAFEVGAYNDLEKISGYENHHLPQAHLAEQVIQGYEASNGMTIRLPKGMHRRLPGSSRLRGDFSGLTSSEARALVSQQFRDLSNAGVPRDSLIELGRGIRSKYPSLYER